MKRQRLHPKLIVLLAVCNYLTEDLIKEIYNILGSKKKWEGKSLIILLSTYFDFETLRLKPFIWQDIWVYNYLFHECNKTANPFDKDISLHKRSLLFKRTKLIVQYEKNIIMPQFEALKNARRIIENLD